MFFFFANPDYSISILKGKKVHRHEYAQYTVWRESLKELGGVKWDLSICIFLLYWFSQLQKEHKNGAIYNPIYFTALQLPT